MNGAHAYTRKIAACVQVAAQRGIIPRTVTLPRRPRSTVDTTFRLAADYGDAMVYVYKLSRSDCDPELWTPVAALQPELGVCLRHYRAAQAAERQQEQTDGALAELEARLDGLAAIVPDGLEHGQSVDRASHR